MTVSSGPIQLLVQLQKSEAGQNNNLLEILGVVKSAKVSKSQLSAIVRGLYTKNSNLLSTLNKSITEFESGSANDKEVIKNFVNDFILSLDNNGLLLFQKYLTQLKESEGTDAISFESKSLCGPLENLLNYITFIDASLEHLRNPFVLDRLKDIKYKLEDIIKDYRTYTNQRKLCSILFTKVRAFGSNKLSSQELVSSYFTIEQIIERSENTDFYIKNGTTNERIELVLLDLTGTHTYNSLAILSIDIENGLEKSRSLLYPPFRINEVSLVHSANHFKLKPIDFSLVDYLEDNTLIIGCADNHVLHTWIAKLSSIFPVERTDSPLRERFLVESTASPTKMFGLGINLVTDNERRSAMASQESLASKTPPALRTPFKELFSPDDSPLGLGASKITPQSQPQPQQKREPSSSSAKSQYKRSLPLIKKTLSENSILDIEDDVKFIQSVNRNTVGLATEDEHRPISSCGRVIQINSIQSEVCTNNDDAISCSSVELTDRELPEHPYKSEFASSVPNLAPPQNKMYSLSSGSAVDINNFGKKYTPSFGSKTQLESPISIPKKTKQKRKSIFNLFKKPSASKLSQSVPGFETVESPIKSGFPINTPTKSSELSKVQQVEDTIDTSEISVETEEEKSENKARSVSTLPAPFALPSSTSTKFFKKPNSSTVSVSQSTKAESPVSELEEVTLTIPQELKDVINNESTVDYFMTNSTPKGIKISKWKEKYGKWEMLTVCEKLFVKITVNYELHKSWLMVFKEEFDEIYNEEIDKPVLILELNPDITDIRRSAALDVEINSTNAITSEKILIIIRSTGALVTEIHSNLTNVLIDLQNVANKNYKSMKASTFSDSTIASSMMENPSKSSTTSSLSSIGFKSRSGSPKNGLATSATTSTNSINDSEVCASCIINNPGSLKVPGISSMTVRLQKQLHSYAKINVPSSWKIVSMFDLKVDKVIDTLTQQNYFHLSLKNEEAEQVYGWLISESSKFEYLETIGKAGLLVKVSEQEMYMIECKGKREIKKLLEVLD